MDAVARTTERGLDEEVSNQDIALGGLTMALLAGLYLAAAAKAAWDRWRPK